ncbi:START-like domain-containing protein [Mangrovibacterium lignilyticum]|uniref:START-like domain-containing protein n=1 Tax=Mangrovibacterium lignilyticum TaxID=2668052 RepID=UPI0013D10FFA|nr:START-like domain-containing protein [Mangrovibacterium lignilyticum]
MTAKSKIQLEFPIKCSPSVLYNRLSTASGLTEWFADDVNVKGKRYIFIWDGSEQVAEMIQSKDSRLVRFKWEDDDDDDTYFEFLIAKDELTGDVTLLITDFADPGEEEETTELWNSQITDLRRVLGC